MLADRFRLSERIVDLCRMLEGLRHQRAAAALRSGIVSALEMARAAEVAVLRDMADVA